MTQILWDSGTAYELFASLVVLHRPTVFGLRPAWAAGVRSRLPQAQRNFLERTFSFLDVPLAWLHNLPEPKDASGVIQELSDLPAAERLAALQFNANTPPELLATCRAIAVKGTWDVDDQEVLRATFHHESSPPKTPCWTTCAAPGLTHWHLVRISCRRSKPIMRSFSVRKNCA